MKRSIHASLLHELADAPGDLIRLVVVAVRSRKHKIIVFVVGTEELLLFFDLSPVLQQDVDRSLGDSNKRVFRASLTLISMPALVTEMDLAIVTTPDFGLMTSQLQRKLFATPTA